MKSPTPIPPCWSYSSQGHFLYPHAMMHHTERNSAECSGCELFSEYPTIHNQICPSQVAALRKGYSDVVTHPHSFRHHHQVRTEAANKRKNYLLLTTWIQHTTFLASNYVPVNSNNTDICKTDLSLSYTVHVVKVYFKKCSFFTWVHNEHSVSFHHCMRYCYWKGTMVFSIPSTIICAERFAEVSLSKHAIHSQAGLHCEEGSSKVGHMLN